MGISPEVAINLYYEHHRRRPGRSVGMPPCQGPQVGAEARVTGGKEGQDSTQSELVPLMAGLWSGLCPAPSFSKDELTQPYSPLVMPQGC